jgi:hypothetical protein
MPGAAVTGAVLFDFVPWGSGLEKRSADFLRSDFAAE